MILPPDQAENETILIITHILWKHKGQKSKILQFIFEKSEIL